MSRRGAIQGFAVRVSRSVLCWEQQDVEEEEWWLTLIVCDVATRIFRETFLPHY